MNEKEQQQLVQSLRASAPPQAQPSAFQAELERFPCTVRPVEVPVEGEPEVTIYLTVPRQVRPGAPVVVNYHGGGFLRGRSIRDEAFCRRLACTFQCVVADVDYALAPEHPFPTAVHQARAAALWAKAQAAGLGCDPNKVLLVGQSAGGNLVANICMEEAAAPILSPLCAVIAYPPLDLKTDPAEKHHSPRDMDPQRARSYNALYCSPELAGDPRVSPLFASPEQLAAFPPTLIITAGDDSLAPEGEEFAKHLAQAGVEVTCKRFPHCIHSFFISHLDAWEEALDLIRRFLEEGLRQAGSPSRLS